MKKQPAGVTIRILPQQSSEHQHVASSASSSSTSPSGPDSFWDAFGFIGILLLLAAGVSVCWTMWLIVLNVSPNATANYLMDTADFDDGRFWLIIDPEPVITMFNTFVLGALAASYVYVILQMTILRNSKLRVAPVGPKKEEATRTLCSRFPNVERQMGQGAAFWIELTGYYGYYRKFWNVLFKVGDLVVEAIQLYHLLEAGFSTTLAYGYAAMIALSCLSQSFFILYPVAHSAFTEVLVDTVFDMLFAIVCPIVLLVYSYTTFDLDRELARLYLQVYFPGSFQRQARMQADPAVTTLFRFAFDSLRTLTWLNLVIRLSMNASFSYRLSRLVEVTQQQRRKLRTTSSKLAKLKAQKPVPRWAGALFLVGSVFAIVYTAKCISESLKVCQAFPECVAFAYRWDQQAGCPCLALIDVDRAPKTYDEWIHPMDVTETVRALALSGDLKMLQLTNRQMAVWPEELQRCVNLEYLSIYYTGVEVVPDWFKVFHKLEFLDLQGKFGDTNIVRMPPDAFSTMGSLTFMHLGYLQLLTSLPSFEGLHNMKSMSIAMLYSIPTLPDLKPPVKLQRLELVAMNALRELPEVESNTHLTHLVVWQAQLCCNGFLSDCNISHPSCSGMARTDCFPIEARPSEDSQAIFASQSGVSEANAPFIPPAQPPAKAQIDACGGVLYRQCRDPVFESKPVGICINSFFQVIACTSLDIFAWHGREQEIQHGLGLSIREWGPRSTSSGETWIVGELHGVEFPLWVVVRRVSRR